MKKSDVQRIIKEEIDKVAEGYSSSGRGGRGGRYGGWDTRGYRGSSSDTPWYRQGGSGRMSDAEARERGGRGYDEPNERDVPRGPRGGMVHSTVMIDLDPGAQSRGDLGANLDRSADVFITRTGYDGMVGTFLKGRNPDTGYYNLGEKWTLSKSSDGGYTFKTGGVIGSGATPSEALTDAAQQGFEDSDTVLTQLGVEPDEFYADPGQAEHERVPGGDMDMGDEGPEDLDEGAEEDEADMNEMEDTVYNADLQARHGRFTTPEEVKGTPEHERLHGAHRAPASGGGGGGYVSRRSEWGDPDLYGGPPRVDESTRRVVSRWNKLAGTLKG